MKPNLIYTLSGGALLLGLLTFMLLPKLIVNDIKTDIAYADAKTIDISPEYDGTIASLNVEENMIIPQGTLLFKMDDTDVKHRIALVKESIAYHQDLINMLTNEIDADLGRNSIIDEHITVLQSVISLRAGEYAKASSLLASHLVSDEDVKQKELLLRKDEAELLAKKTEKSTLWLYHMELVRKRAGFQSALRSYEREIKNLMHHSNITSLVTQHDAVISSIYHREGEFVEAGEPVLKLVLKNNFWVDAYFKEQDSAHIHTGDKFVITFDAYPDTPVDAYVKSVSPLAGAKLSSISPNYTSGNFTRIVQKVPVRLALVNKPDELAIIPGMSSKVRSY